MCSDSTLNLSSPQIKSSKTTMCLGIPMQIKAINDCIAICESKGIQREVNLYLLIHESLSIGDFVMVHVGYAIQRVNPEQAQASWDLFDQMNPSEPETV